MTLREKAKALLPEAALWKLDQAWVEKLELRAKLVLVPHLLFGKTFDRGQRPYQDLSLLVRVRNEFVHYKMSDLAPKFVGELQAKGVALRAPRAREGADYIWLHQLCSTEGIRWAHNAMVATAAPWST